ncbi:hypothetical protein FQZ97_1163020 [compost metagenome]
MGIDAAGRHAAAAQRAVHEKVQCIQRRQLVSLHRPFDHIGEVSGQAFGGQDLLEVGEVARIAAQDGNVGEVALVARSRMRDRQQGDVNHALEARSIGAGLLRTRGRHRTLPRDRDRNHDSQRRLGVQENLWRRQAGLRWLS